MEPPVLEITASQFTDAIDSILTAPDLTDYERAAHLYLARIVYGVTKNELADHLAARAPRPAFAVHIL